MADTSIYANYLRPVKSVAEYDAEANQREANAFALQDARMKNQLAQQAMADDQATRAAYMTGGAETDVLKRLQQGGQYKAAIGLQEQMAKRAKEAADLGKVKSETSAKDFETANKRLDTYGQAMGWLRQNPSLENAAAVRSHLANLGIMSPEQLQQGFAQVEANPTPENIARLAGMGFQSAINAKEQLVKESNINQGGYQSVGSFNPVTGQRTEATRQTITESEAEKLKREQQAREAAAGRAVTMRGQDMVDARTRETQAEGKWQYDAARGGLVNMQTGEFKPAMQDGKPIGEKDKALTDAQSKAVLFGSRMDNSNGIITELAKTGTNVSVPGSRAPGVGMAITALSSSDQQRLDQAKRDFINATLRRESGAVISPSEFDNAEKQYFPQINDKPDVIKQKQNNREIAIRGMKAEVPKAQQGLFNEVIGGKGSPNPAGKTITRTGTMNGRKVVQYSDGTTEYAN